MTPGARIVRRGSGPRRELRNGRGEVERIADSELGAQHVDVHVNVLRTGVAPGPYHLHTAAENAYYILSGEVLIVVAGEEHLLRPGDAAFIPPGVPHSATNVGDAEARLVEIYAPADPDFVEVDPAADGREGAIRG